MTQRTLASVALTITTLCAIFVAPRDVQACGGCFAPPPPSPDRAQVVTDHRMVFSLSQRQTTLWDQIRYTGNPEDFVWVLPVANAATLQIGLADDNFVESLDAYTAPFVTAPYPACFGSRPPLARDSGFGGAFMGCGSGSNAMGTPGAGSESTRISRDGETVVGPYAIVVISTKNGDARLDEWLRDHGYVMPRETRDAINYYVDLQFDFVIMRLAPGAGVHQMQPIRVSMRGYNPALPLRMIAAGIGDKVGLNLMVISDSRVEAQGFSNLVMHDSELSFDWSTNRSNWRELWNQIMRREQGRAWIIESVQGIHENQFTYRVGWGSPRDGGIDVAMPRFDGGMFLDGDPGMDALMPADVFLPMGDSGPFWGDANFADAMAEAGDGGRAMEMVDGGMRPASDPYVDRRFAFSGLNGRAVITRMRTELGLADLWRDLVIQSSDAGLVPVEYVAGIIRNQPPCPSGRACSVVGGATPAVLEGLAVVALILRRRRRRARAEAQAERDALSG